MKKLLAMILAVVMILSLCTVAFATDTTTVTPTLPTGSTMASTPSGITSITINGDTAVYHTDSDGITYIRAIDNGGSEYALKHATIVFRKSRAATSIQSSEMTISNAGLTATATVDLFNKAYNVSIAGTTYVIAAGLPKGSIAIDANDPLAVNAATIGGATGTVTATNVQNPYIGNTAKSGEDGWTFVNYKIDAAMEGSDIDRANVDAVITAASGATFSGCYSDAAHKMNLNTVTPFFTLTNGSESRNYYVFATDANTFTVSYGFDFTEAKASEYYTGDVAEAVDTLESQAKAFFGGECYNTITVTSGQTVMDIMHNFAVAYGYEAEVPEGCTYMATLNGIGEFTFGSMSGWMYTDGPSWDGSGAALYETWNTPPVGAADYTLTAGDTICWFICCDYTHHPWN